MREGEHEALNYLLQRDVREALPRFTREMWLPVYDSCREEERNGGTYCALLTAKAAATALSQPSWDIHIGVGGPGFSLHHDGGADHVSYERFGTDEGIEPLVFFRDYHSLRPSHVEVSEEFRHFHNAFWDPQQRQLVKFEEDGIEIIIGRMRGERLELRLPEVRQFLAARQLHLALYVDFVRFADVSPNLIPSSERRLVVREPTYVYSLHVAVNDPLLGGGKPFSRLLGKVLLPPPPIEESKIWPYDERAETFPAFIIGVAENGSSIEYTCDPEALDNYFGKNPGAPDYLTPVYFKRDVLAKYYAEPARYSVDDGHLWCGGLWVLRMDNNLPDYVVVFLGDLGKELPERERGYWRAFNVIPDGGVSNVNLERSFYGRPAEPESPDLLFKYVLPRFTETWRSAFGWPLFRPLVPADAHHLETLRVPLTEGQAEFDAQILNLTKILVDSINERALAGALSDLDASTRGISKLEAFLEAYNVPDRETHIKFLRDLQDLRSSGVAHRKGSRYGSVSSRFSIGELALRDVFRRILGRAIGLLRALEEVAQPR